MLRTSIGAAVLASALLASCNTAGTLPTMLSDALGHHRHPTSTPTPAVSPAVKPTTTPTTSPTPSAPPTASPTPKPTPTPSPTPSPSPSPTPTPTATPSPTPTAAPTSAPVWQAGSATLGHWVVANTYQCGTPVVSGASYTFSLVKNGTSCGRNQANPTDASGNLIRLTDGVTYSWSFDYIDGTPSGGAPGMGLDTGSDPESLIWQIHGYNEPDTPCTSLNFANGAYYGGKAGQEWALWTCNGVVWQGTYSPGETDHWQIVATISSGTAGETKLYRNGVLVADDHGANYHNSTGAPWWNFGPYKWRWELASPGSSMTVVNATINNLSLTTVP